MGQTKADKLKASKFYDSGQWFSAADCAYVCRIPKDNARTLLAQMKDDVEMGAYTHGKERLYRRRRPTYNFARMRIRNEYGFGESDSTPRYY